jgi:hypothetical protein
LQTETLQIPPDYSKQQPIAVYLHKPNEKRKSSTVEVDSKGLNLHA